MLTPRQLGSCRSLAVLCVCVFSAHGAEDSNNKIRKSWDYQVKLYGHTQAKLRGKPIPIGDRFAICNRYVAEKCKDDKDRNMNLAKTCAAKAVELQEKNEKKAKSYVMAAKAFKRCSELNTAVWDAYEKRDSAAMVDGLAGIVKMERVVAEALGKCSPWGWDSPIYKEGVWGTRLSPIYPL